MWRVPSLHQPPATREVVVQGASRVGAHLQRALFHQDSTLWLAGAPPLAMQPRGSSTTGSSRAVAAACGTRGCRGWEYVQHVRFVCLLHLLLQQRTSNLPQHRLQRYAVRDFS